MPPTGSPSWQIGNLIPLTPAIIPGKTGQTSGNRRGEGTKQGLIHSTGPFAGEPRFPQRPRAYNSIVGAYRPRGLGSLHGATDPAVQNSRGLRFSRDTPIRFPAWPSVLTAGGSSQAVRTTR
jgi:hypothetical protein